jgi:hypothetical protein
MRPIIPFEENGIRVVMGASNPIVIYETSRMDIEQAHAFIACIERAIDCYCRELEKERRVIA